MTTINANEVALGIESFGDDDAPLVLLAGGTTMLSWPDALCERLATGGRRVVRYDLRDSGESTTADPAAPTYTLRDLAADAAALVDALGGVPAHLAGIGVGGMVAQAAALDHPGAFSALTLAGTRAVAPGKPDADLPDHDKATMKRLFTRPMPDWTDREAVANFAAARAEILGDDPGAARAIELRGTSLLAVGVTGSQGAFAAGDAVELADPTGRVIGKGISGLSADEVRQVVGLSTADMRVRLPGAPDEVIHRDQLVLVGTDVV